MMELDELNKNPCMKMILLIIKELHTSITPPPAELAKDDAAMPSWMKDIHRKLVNPSKPSVEIALYGPIWSLAEISDNFHFKMLIGSALNIRLFLAKIIINMPEAFEMYARSWVRPLMRLAMEGESYGEPMSYFVQDLCVLVVVWGNSVKLADTYDDRVLLLGFLVCWRYGVFLLFYRMCLCVNVFNHEHRFCIPQSYIMKHCYHEQRQYLLNNIELIKGVFENWSSIAIVPTVR